MGYSPIFNRTLWDKVNIFLINIDNIDASESKKREIRMSTLRIAPRLNHMSYFDITFWFFTIAHSFQNAAFKTFIIMAVILFE
jgi:hypothetical protein